MSEKSKQDQCPKCGNIDFDVCMNGIFCKKCGQPQKRDSTVSRRSAITRMDENELQEAFEYAESWGDDLTCFEIQDEWKRRGYILKENMGSNTKNKEEA